MLAANRPGVDQAMNNVMANKTSNDASAPTVTPFGMAMLAASIARGSAPMPMMVFGQPATADVTPSALPGDVNNRLA